MKISEGASYTVFLLDEAKADILNATDYYNSLVSGLGYKFQNDLKSLIRKVESNPFSFGFRHSNFRSANLVIFPYQIHYIIEELENRVILFAVLHGVRSPTYIKKRRKKE